MIHAGYSQAGVSPEYGFIRGSGTMGPKARESQISSGEISNLVIQSFPLQNVQSPTP